MEIDYESFKSALIFTLAFYVLGQFIFPDEPIYKQGSVKYVNSIARSLEECKFMTNENAGKVVQHEWRTYKDNAAEKIFIHDYTFFPTENAVEFCKNFKEASE